MSYPESADLDKFGDKVAGDVECDEGLEAADGSAADEDGGGGEVAGCSGGGGVGVVAGEREGGDLVVVQLDDGGVDADGGEEILHDVAHAARGAREDYDWVF